MKEGVGNSSFTLAIETSCAVGSVALGHENALVEVRQLSAPRRHTVEFLPTVSAICDAHGVQPGDLGIIAVSAGPGSFTGLRIGVTTARILAMATGARIVRVPTLDVIAQNAIDAVETPTRLVVLLDAKRNRVYASAFEIDQDKYISITDPVETDPAEFLSAHRTQDGDCAVLGEGVAYHKRAVKESHWTVLSSELDRPRAETVFRLGLEHAQANRFVDRRSFIPTYIRPPEAEEKWNSTKTK